MFRLYIIKRTIEDILLLPFIWLGRLIAALRPLDAEYEIFFFFPFYHVGGAETVHARIAQVLGNKRCIIFFTRRSHNDFFYERFAASGCTIRDISRYTDNKWLYFLNCIFRGIITGYINRQRLSPVVFNGQCNFAYKIAPWVKRSIPQVELIHSFNTFSWIRIPFLPFISKTIMISKTRIADHKQQYRQLGIPEKYAQRILYVPNGIPLSKEPVTRHADQGPLRVLYVGRGTPEKRVHIIAQMAEKMSGQLPAVRFLFLGDVQQAIPERLHKYCEFYPYESDEHRIQHMYDEADVVIIVSSTEGFPMVVMEAMARGCAIIATPVGDLPVHIQQEVNGFLFSTVEDEQLITEEGVRFITRLAKDGELRRAISEHNIAYAQTHFSLEQFAHAYRQLIHSLK
jgi:glycosyltransferase involved in cell wall biosynthesis